MKARNLSRHSQFSWIVFWFSLAVLGLWLWLPSVDDVYRYPVVGALFEALWLPWLLLPVVSFVCWAAQKFKRRSLYAYSFLVSTAAVVQYALRVS